MAHPALHDRRYRPDDPRSSFADATALLYEAFGFHPHDPSMSRCGHCVTEAEVWALAGDVSALPAPLVSRFARKAGTTWGGPADLRRVTPRLLVLAADGQLEVGRAALWSALRRAGWPQWPAAEVAAVDGFLAAEWLRLIRSPVRPAHRAHRWLAEIAAGVADLSPFLAAWHDALGPLPHPRHQDAAAGHLVDLITNSAFRPDVPGSMADVLPGRPAAADQLAGWLAGPGTAHELARAAARLTGTSAARRTDVAVERLRRYRARVAPTPLGR